jgi:hypothetical protein
MTLSLFLVVSRAASTLGRLGAWELADYWQKYQFQEGKTDSEPGWQGADVQTSFVSTLWTLVESSRPVGDGGRSTKITALERRYEPLSQRANGMTRP